ncbi:hypothetical protein D9M72_441530 [compost metagenome]
MLNQPVLAQPVREGQLPRAIEHVAIAIRTPVIPLTILAQTNADPGLRHPGQVELGASTCRGHGRPGDVQLSHLLYDPGGHIGVDVGQIVGVGKRDASLHAQCAGAFEDEFRTEDPQMAGLVQVNIHVHPVLLGQLEDDVQMAGRVAVQLAGINAADGGRPRTEGLLKERHSAVLEEEARLGESHDFYLGRVGEALLRRQDCFEALKLAVHIDLRIGTDACGAPRNHPFQRSCHHIRVRDGRVTPVFPVVVHHVPHPGRGGVLPKRQSDPGRVEVDVHVRESGEGDAAASVDRAAGGVS